MIKVKLLCNWCHSNALAQSWNKMSQGNFRWNNIQILTDDSVKPDYYCLINFTESEEFDPTKTIYMTMEPLIHIQSYPGKWNSIKKSDMLYTLPRNNIEWHLGKTYSELSREPIIKTKLISTVVSDLYRDPGHIKRVDFIKYLQQQDFDLDIYGRSNKLNLKNYLGPLPTYNKDAGILPYKYTIACENSSEKGYFTEKIVDAILGECLCFYWGCPNITEYLNEMTYIRLDLDDFQKSYQIIKNAIATNQWEVRLTAIKKAKYKILNELQFFPTLARICNSFHKPNNH